MNVTLSRFILPLLALSMGGLGFYHVQQHSHPAPPTSAPEDPPIAAFDQTVAGTGVVEAETENINIGTALTGLIMEVHVPSSNVGQHVKAGTPLFRIDDRNLKAQLAVAEAQLASAQANLAKLQQMPRPEELPPSLAKLKATIATAAMMQDQHERAKRMVVSQSLSQEEFVTRQRTHEAAVQEQARAQAEYDLLKAGAWQPDLAIAGAAVKEAEAKVEQLRTEIDRAVVTAPVDAVVLQVSIRPGERISELDTRALMILGRIDVCHVRVDIDERDIPRWRPGAPARASRRGDAAHALNLRFVRVEPYVIPKKSLTGENTERVDTRVLQVIYAIEPNQPQVYVGQQLDVFVSASK